MMGNLQTLPSWSKYFNNPSGDVLSTMNNGVSIGALGAIPFASFINDSFGRKTIIIVVTSFIDRDSLPISESGNDKLSIRQFPGGLVPSCVISYISSMKYKNWSWRLPSLLQALFPGIESILTILAPESPRWLIANEQYDKAFEVLTKYHAGGDKESPLVKFEMAEISAALDKEKLGKQFTWNVWFKTKANMHRLFLSLVVP